MHAAALLRAQHHSSCWCCCSVSNGEAGEGQGV
jgi:hypothetical protein